ncbi:MAG: tetratricopeptide repeat protein [Planctomycetota bacterium]
MTGGGAAGTGDERRVGGLSLRLARLMPFALALVCVGVYVNSLGNQFVFDTDKYIDAIAEAVDPWSTFRPSQPMSRSLPQATLVANYLIDGDEPRGYRLVNIAIHAVSAMVLFGLTWRLGWAWRRRDPRAPGAASTPPEATAGVGLASAVSLLWAVHPLCTQAVAYVIQRHESMMALFFLLSLWALAGAAQSRGTPARVGWGALAVAAAFASVSSKQVAVGLPVVAYLMDRCFYAGSWVGPIRRRWPIYLGLLAASGWLLIAGGEGLVVEDAQVQAVGFGAGGWYGSAQYLLSQGEVLLAYLRLVVMPWPQVFDWAMGWQPAFPHRPVIMGVTTLAVAGLFIASLIGVMRNTAWGWLGLSTFVVLGPTSSVMPITDLYFEHRVYLPLAALLAIGCLATNGLIAGRMPSEAWRKLAVAGVLAIATVFAGLTVVRNAEYATRESLWRTVTLRAPANPRGWHNYGRALEDRNKFAMAETAYRQALDRRPDYIESRNSLAVVLLHQGRTREALGQLNLVVELDPELARSYYNRADAHLNLGNFDAAAADYGRAIELSDEYAQAHANLGVIDLQQGRTEAALSRFRRAVEVDPTVWEGHNNLTTVLMELGRWTQAEAAFDEAFEHMPGERRLTVRWAKLKAGAPDESIRQPQAAGATLDSMPTAFRNPAWGEAMALALANTDQAEPARAMLGRLLATDAPPAKRATFQRYLASLDAGQPVLLQPTRSIAASDATGSTPQPAASD